MGLPAIKDDVVPAPAYSVGYGSPPVHTRFEPGRSGNPRGRPRGAKNKRPGHHLDQFEDMLLDEAYRPITVMEKGRPRKISTMQAVTRVIAANAMKGHARPQKLLLEAVRAAETRKRAEHERYVGMMADLKTGGAIHIAECLAAGRPYPLVIPHPADIDFDPRTGEFTINGPQSYKEYKIWKQVAAQRDDARELIVHFKSEAATTRSVKRRKLLEGMMLKAAEKEQEAVLLVGEWPKHWTDTSDDDENIADSADCDGCEDDV